WREQFHAALNGGYFYPPPSAPQEKGHHHHIPPGDLHSGLYCVEMELDTNQYSSFPGPYSYFYRLWSVVGVSCIHIWGFHDERAKGYAEAAGTAFQLTNILRDLREDAARGRVYLPREDLDRFDYSVDDLQRAVLDDRFRALMRFQTERARSYY